MELLRLDSLLAWQREFRCQCLHPRGLTKLIGFKVRSCGYILKGPFGLATIPVEDYPGICLFCMYGLW